jgi:hypothetical protein
VTVHPLDLEASILAVESAVRSSSRRATTLSDDPLDLDLPPLQHSTGAIAPETMATLGGLYLIGWLEQTGMLRAGELLVERRSSLDLRSVEAAELLDEAAVASAAWYPEDQRQLLFARVFGMGAAGRDRTTSNDPFEGLLMEVCGALVAWGDDARFDRPPARFRTSSLRSTVRELRSNLADRQHGNTLSAARRLAAQVRVAHELLNHDGIIALVAGRTMWDVVRAMWEQPPDIDRLVTKGQSGHHVIAWAGSSSADQSEPTGLALDSAWLWLQATHDIADPVQRPEGTAA